MNASFWGLIGVPLWMVLLPAAFLVICLFILIAYISRGPKWFSRREDRRELAAAALEILEHRRARGEISEEQFAALNKDVSTMMR
jgi:uncharacterized membrane protein